MQLCSFSISLVSSVWVAVVLIMQLLLHRLCTYVVCICMCVELFVYHACASVHALINSYVLLQQNKLNYSKVSLNSFN